MIHYIRDTTRFAMNIARTTTRGVVATASVCAARPTTISRRRMGRARPSIVPVVTAVRVVEASVVKMRESRVETVVESVQGYDCGGKVVT